MKSDFEKLSKKPFQVFQLFHNHRNTFRQRSLKRIASMLMPITKIESSAGEKLVPPDKIDAAMILTSLTNSPQLFEVQASLDALTTAVAGGNKDYLSKTLTTHAALLDALFIRLLSDAATCKSERLTATVLELALKTSDATRRTILAANEISKESIPLVALQINNG